MKPTITKVARNAIVGAFASLLFARIAFSAASTDILLGQSSAPPSSSATVRAADVEVTIALSADHAAAGQQLGVSANFNIAPGWHIYGQPIASNYTATTITMEGDAAGAQSMVFPKPEMVKFEALGETLPVYKGSFKATGKLMIKPGTKPGDYTLAGTVKFQECNDSICKMPQSASFILAFKVDPMTGPAPK